MEGTGLEEAEGGGGRFMGADCGGENEEGWVETCGLNRIQDRWPSIEKQSNMRARMDCLS
jgi:hypothetical protein